jgi:hypothetical protein
MRTTYSKEEETLVSEINSVPRRRNPLWWIYFGYYAVALAAGTYLLLASFSYRMTSILSIVFDALGLICLYGFLRSKPLITRTFWVSFTIFYFCKTAFAAVIFLRTLLVFGWQGDNESYVTLLGLVGLLLGLPALAAFWLYSFRSPALWESTNGERAG